MNKIQSFILRSILISLVSFLIVIFVIIYSEHNFDLKRDISYIAISMLAFVIGSEGILFIDKKLNKKIPWNLSIKRRLFFQTVITMVWFTTLVIIVKPFFITDDALLSHKSFELGVIFGIFFTILFDILLVVNNFYIYWQKTNALNAKLREEKLESDYKALQDQLNPHFLFNSLNVLIYEIKSNPENAIKYTQELSDIYRYVLKSKNNYTISLEKELAFLESYIYLYKVKYGKNLEVKIDIAAEYKNYELPPMVLQILVENAFKHNIINSEQALFVEIFANKNTITVKNNLQLKEATYSTETGLANLKKRYEFLTDKKVKIQQTKDSFIVEVPLLNI